jgi:type IX secretion system PorP/SprF family membrane protein
MSITALFGQQDPHYTQYMYNQNIINPAYAGSKGTLSLSLLGRSQWIGFSGAPETLTLAIHSPIGEKTGLGLSIIHDEIGPVIENNIFADFSYTISLENEKKVAFGIKAGLTTLDVSSISGLDPDYVLNTPIQKSSPNFGAGIFYYSSKFYAGFSIPNFLQTRHLELDNGVNTTASEKMHYFLTSGYVFDIKKNLKLKPSTMIKMTSGAPLSIDMSINALYNDKFEFGLNYRFEDSLSAILGFQISDEFKLGYAYDYTTSNLSEFNSGSHEVILIYDFKTVKSRLKSPRYF